MTCLDAVLKVALNSIEADFYVIDEMSMVPLVPLNSVLEILKINNT